jgi:hypothetical protein
MTRSHVLLHCPNARLAAARVEAWEGKDPGPSVQPRWERRLLRFIELSGVGMVMEDGGDLEELGHLEWTGGLFGRRRRGSHQERTIDYHFLLFSHSFIFSVRRIHTPRPAHSARWGRRISCVVVDGRGRQLVFLRCELHIPWGNEI